MRAQQRFGVFFGLAVLGAVLGAFLWYRAGEKQPTTAIERGLSYLATAYSPYHYADPYLEYVYPGEMLTCPLKDCHITYRVLDAFFDVLFLKQENSSASLLGRQLQDASATLNALLPEWRTANLSNTILGAEKEGVALDTACILGYVERDVALADHVATFLTPDGNWLNDDLYADDLWRNIADETWCIRLFAVTHQLAGHVPNLVETKIRETTTFLADNHQTNDQIGVLYHMILLLADVNDPRYQSTLDAYVTQLATISQQSEVHEQTMTLANILEALIRGGYDDHTLLERIATILQNRQQANGSWFSSTTQESFPVFTTFRVTLALTSYNQNATASSP
ncbi:MAG: hypothetical protein V1778_05015 [bacterium]